MQKKTTATKVLVLLDYFELMREKSIDENTKSWFEDGIVTFYRRCLDSNKLQEIFELSNLQKNNKILGNAEILEVKL